MKKKELTKAREQSVKALEKRINEINDKIILLYAKMKAGQEENPKEIRNLKHERAQLKTLVTEKRKVEATEKKEGVKEDKTKKSNSEKEEGVKKEK